MTRTYRCISADSHLEIAPELWTPRLPAQYRDRAPRLVRLENGSDAWAGEGGRPHTVFPDLMAGRPFEDWSPIGARYEGAAGTGSPEQRVRDLDLDGVDAEVLFPSVAQRNLYCRVADDEAHRAIVRAYNDFLAEDYCAYDPERLMGLGVIPETGVDDAIAEMEHCLKLGLKGIVLGAYPSGHGYPSRADDTFWAAAVDMRVPVTVHVQFSVARYDRQKEPVFSYDRPVDRELGRQDPVARMSRYGVRGAQSVVQLVMAGVFERFPGLRIYFAENQIGWVPAFLEQMDNQYRRHQYWAEDLLGLKRPDRPPSEYAREHVLWGFQYDSVGVQVRHLIGVRNLMWATDFPHAETDWPHSQRVIEDIFVGVPEEEKHQMVAGNAVEFFRLSEGE